MQEMQMEMQKKQMEAMINALKNSGINVPIIGTSEPSTSRPSTGFRRGPSSSYDIPENLDFDSHSEDI